MNPRSGYEMRISDWSADVCSPDLYALAAAETDPAERMVELVGVLPAQCREDFTLRLAGQVGARRRRRHEKAWEAKWGAHRCSITRGSDGNWNLYAHSRFH